MTFEPTPDNGLIWGIQYDFDDLVCGGVLRLAMLMAGPDKIDRMAGGDGWTGWGETAKSLVENKVRVICSKSRMNHLHPLIGELRREGISVTMVAFEPGQDGFFVFLGHVSQVDGDGVECYSLPAGDSWRPSLPPVVYWRLPVPFVFWIKPDREPDDCNAKCIILGGASRTDALMDYKNRKS